MNEMKESLQSKDGFRTSDLHLAAFLVARGWELAHIDMLPRGRGVFLFPKDAQADAQEFFQGGQVVALKFAYAVKDLKTRIDLTAQEVRRG